LAENELADQADCNFQIDLNRHLVKCFFFAQSQKRLLKMHLQVAIAGVAEGRDCRRLASQVKLGSIL
jgi:hypothetical protein